LNVFPCCPGPVHVGEEIVQEIQDAHVPIPHSGEKEQWGDAAAICVSAREIRWSESQAVCKS
jgi:hypothetical protein